MASPLYGLKILDFTYLLPGPYASLYLADLGAEVLRILWSGRSDLAELMSSIMPDTRISAIKAYLSRGKRSFSLDLKSPMAVQVIKRLLSTYDILLEGYRPGVMESLGLGYNDLSKVAPNLIYCSLTGFGQNGPWANKPGHDINYLALSGIMSYSGRKDSGPPPLGVQFADLAGGSLNAIIGILAAVISRKNSGLGQHIDIAIFDGVLALNPFNATALLADDSYNPIPEGEMLNGGTIYDYYCTSDGHYLSVGPVEPKFLRNFCTILGFSELIEELDEVAKDNKLVNLTKAKTKLKKYIATRPLAYWIKIFQNTETCVEPVLSLREVLESDQVKKRKMIVEFELSEGKRLRQLGMPIKFSTSSTTLSTLTVISDDNEEKKKIFLIELGFKEEEIEELIKFNILALN